MKTLVQFTYYTPRRVLQIIEAIENTYLIGQKNRQDLYDPFLDTTLSLKEYISIGEKDHYYCQHISCYLDSIAKANPNYSREAFEAIIRAFDIDGKYKT